MTNDRSWPKVAGQIKAIERPLLGKADTAQFVSHQAPDLAKLSFSAGNLPDSVRHRCDSNRKNVRGRLQSFTNEQLVTRLHTKKMARPTGFEPVTPAFGGQYSIQLSYGRVGVRTIPHFMWLGSPAAVSAGATITGIAYIRQPSLRVNLVP